MMQANAYNGAFRSHHLLRFNWWVLGSSWSVFGSKSAIRETSKRLFEGSHVEDTIRNPFWVPFWNHFGRPRDSKGHGHFVRRPPSFVVSPFSVRVTSGTRFWDPPGLRFRSLWPSTWLKPLLEFLSERPGAVQEYFFSVLEPSKSTPRGLRDCSKRPARGQEAPRGLQ